MHGAIQNQNPPIVIYAPLLWVSPNVASTQICYPAPFNKHHLCTAIMGIAQSFCRSLHKYAFRHPAVNIIYALLLWVSPKVSVTVYTNMLLFSSKTLSSASSNSHAFDSVEIWYLQTSPLACYRYFGHFHSFSF